MKIAIYIPKGILENKVFNFNQLYTKYLKDNVTRIAIAIIEYNKIFKNKGNSK